MYLMTQANNGISALDLSRQLGVSYNSAWSVKHKLVQVMKERDDTRPLGGWVQLNREGRPVRMRLSRVGAFSKRGARRLGQAPPRARLRRVLRRLGVLFRRGTRGLFSSTVRDRRRTGQCAASGAVLGQYGLGQHQAFSAWQLSLCELQTPAARPRRVLLSVQLQVLAARDVSPPSVCRLANYTHGQPRAQTG